MGSPRTKYSPPCGTRPTSPVTYHRRCKTLREVLLDENIPVQLYRQLTSAGVEAEHLIVRGQRGIPDSEIRARLARESDLVLLTHDTEFLDPPPSMQGRVIVSRLPQGLSVGRCVGVWLAALTAFAGQPPPGHVFELLASGEVISWER